MNVSSWLQQNSKFISKVDAEVLMMTALGKQDRSDLVLTAERELTADELDMLQRMVRLRLLNVPVAYITGHKEFYGREFEVDTSVLIPRPETETMIDVVKELLEKWPGDVSKVKIADVGTGSGCIAITLALETKVGSVLGIDLWEEPLYTADENAQRLGAKNVHFVDNDLLEGYPPDMFDIVVANLPYVDENWEWTSPELKYEPATALFAENGGLSEIYRLIDQCEAKYLVLEADPSQHQDIINYAQSNNYECQRRLGFILTFKTPAFPEK